MRKLCLALAFSLTIALLSPAFIYANAESIVIKEEDAVQTANEENENSEDVQSETESETENEAGFEAERQTYIYNFSANQYLQGIFAKGQEYFLLGNWEIHSINLHMEYSVTPLLQEGNADITFYINNMPFHSLLLQQDKGTRQVMDISVPLDSIETNAGNALAFEFYLRSNADNCIDDLTSSNWVNIFEESYISVQFTPLNTCQNISEFYKCFTSPEVLYSKQSGMFLNATPTADELTVAANTACGVSGNAQTLFENISIDITDSAKDIQKKQYVIYISRLENLNSEIRALLTKADIDTAGKGALIKLLNYKGTNVLLLTGTDEDTFLQCGKILSNKLLMPQLVNEYKAVLPGDEYQSEAHYAQQYINFSSGVQVKGSFQQDAYFFIDYPANRKITPSSEISLDFRYAENLDFERSLVTVYINDEPAGSKKLSKENAAADTLELNFPDDIDISGSFSIRVSFNLDIGDDWCRQTPDDMPWAYVSETSMLKISSTDLPYLEFTNYPHPFLQDGSVSNTVFILPPNPEIEDVIAMHKISLMLGRYVKDNLGSLSVAYSNNMPNLSNANIIAVGEYSRNEILQENKDELPFKFSGNGLLLPNEKAPVDSTFGQTLGVGQIVFSPYSTEVNALLVLSGSSGQAMLNAVDALATDNGLLQLYGDAFLADGQENIDCFLYDEDRREYTMPVEKAEESGGGLSALLIIEVTVLLLLILCLVLFIKKYGRRKNGR